MKKIAVLTGGGDSSGINAVLRAIVVTATQNQIEVLGVKHGWRGLIEGDFQSLNLQNTEMISSLDGTILGTSRTNPYRQAGQVEKIEQVIKDHKIDGLIAIGGDDTLGVAGQLGQAGLPVVGIPQTIDNDIYGTEYCVGFDTALNQVVNAIRDMMRSNIAHQKDMIVEVMGRDNGWIALASGLACQADYIVLPEHPLKLDHLIQSLEKQKAMGKDACLVVVAEGLSIEGVDRGESVDAFGNKALAGISQSLADLVKEEKGWDMRVQVLGFLQRGGKPTAMELRNSIQMGQYAVDLLVAGDLNKMVARVKDQLTTIPLADVVGNKAEVASELVEMAQRYGVFGI